MERTQLLSGREFRNDSPQFVDSCCLGKIDGRLQAVADPLRPNPPPALCSHVRASARMTTNPSVILEQIATQTHRANTNTCNDSQHETTTKKHHLPVLPLQPDPDSVVHLNPPRAYIKMKPAVHPSLPAARAVTWRDVSCVFGADVQGGKVAGGILGTARGFLFRHCYFPISETWSTTTVCSGICVNNTFATLQCEKKNKTSTATAEEKKKKTRTHTQTKRMTEQDGRRKIHYPLKVTNRKRRRW